MAIISDSKLVQMAADRGRPLLLVLNRSNALTPLVIVLAVLPGLVALEHQPFDEAGAVWGLQSLDLLAASSVDEVVDPALRNPESPLKWQPPLGTWLTALTMSVCGTAWPIALTLVSYVSTAGLVMMVFVLFRRLADSRLAFWSALLASCHAPLLSQVQNPAPNSLAVLLALVVMWGYVSHLQDSTGLVSMRLLLAGAALGLCLLAGGPLVLVLLAVLMCYVLQARHRGLHWELSDPAGESGAPIGWSTIGSLLAVVSIGCVIGGWWLVMMDSRYPAVFRYVWMTGATVAGGSTSTAFVENGAGTWTVAVLGKLGPMLGYLWGVWLLGVWQAVRQILKSKVKARRRSLLFCLEWTACGVVAWLASIKHSGGTTFYAEMCHVFVMIPCLAVAAFAMDEIAQRRVRGWLALTAILAPLAISYGSRFVASGVLSSWWLVALTLLAGGVAVWGLREYCALRDSRRMFVLRFSVALLLVVNAAYGLQRVQFVSENDRALAGFRKWSTTRSEIDYCVLMTKQQPPAHLLFELRSLWPSAVLDVTDSWKAALANPTLGNYRSLICIDWDARDIRPANLHVQGFTISQQSPPQYFRGAALRAYELRSRPNKL